MIVQNPPRLPARRSRRGRGLLALVAAASLSAASLAVAPAAVAQVATTDICDRTWWLEAEILEQTTSADTCDSVSVTELGAITELDFSDLGPGTATVPHNKLKHDDLRGLTGLTRLDLSGLGLSAFGHSDGVTRLSLPGAMFSDLSGPPTCAGRSP